MTYKAPTGQVGGQMENDLVKRKTFGWFMRRSYAFQLILIDPFALVWMAAYFGGDCGYRLSSVSAGS